MHVSNSTWTRIRSDFTAAEYESIVGAMEDGSWSSAAGIQIDERALRPQLALKLRDAVIRVNPGA